MLMWAGWVGEKKALGDGNEKKQKYFVSNRDALIKSH